MLGNPLQKHGWLPNEPKGMPEEIGGRDIDLSQIGYSLGNHLRNAFPMNQVPPGLVVKSGQLTATLIEAETKIREFIEAVTEEWENFNKRPNDGIQNADKRNVSERPL